MIYSMRASIIFDRFIDSNKHYISPGGYEIIDKNDRHLEFDFEQSYCKIDSENKRKLNIEVIGVDTSCFPQSAYLEEYVRNIKCFEEFFVYTGEEGEDEEILYPVKVSDVCFTTDKDEDILIDSTCLIKVNYDYHEILKEEGKGWFMYQVFDNNGFVEQEFGFSNYTECCIALGGHLGSGTSSIPEEGYRWRIFERKNGVYTEIENNIPLSRNQRRNYETGINLTCQCVLR